MRRTPSQTIERTAPVQLTVVLRRSKTRSRALQSLNVKVVVSEKSLRDLLKQPAVGGLWISYDKTLTKVLLQNLARPQALLAEGIFAHELSSKTIAALSSSFKHFAFSEDGGFLEPDELAEALRANNRRDLVIGGLVDKSTKTVTLWRGNLEPLTVPFSAFPKSGDGIDPEFDSFSASDFGQTVRLGKYEAAIDAILYEYDSDFRSRINKDRRANQRSFGASLRRLRKQKGFRREDFAPSVSPRTIARIEQDIVAKPHESTLAKIAAVLGVLPEEVGTY